MKKLADFYDANKKTISENAVTISEYFSKKHEIHEDPDIISEDFKLSKKGRVAQVKEYPYTPKTKQELVKAISDLIIRKLHPEKFTDENDIIQTEYIKKMPDDTLDLNCINTSEITDMSYLFKEMFRYVGWQDQNSFKRDIKELILDDWDVSNVITMEGLFSMEHNTNYDLNVDLIDISGWSTYNVKDMSLMFHGCGGLKEIRGIDSLDFYKCKTVNSMFWGCPDLTELDLSSWKTLFIEDLGNMFEGCKNLANIYGIENFKINKKIKKNPRKYLSDMFYGCPETLQKPDWYKNLMGDN